MGNDFIAENDQEKPLPNVSSIPDISNLQPNQDKDQAEEEFIKELPDWDLEPPFEPVRRVNRK